MAVLGIIRYTAAMFINPSQNTSSCPFNEPVPRRVRYLAQISSDIEAEYFALSDSVQISAGSAANPPTSPQNAPNKPPPNINEAEKTPSEVPAGTADNYGTRQVISTERIKVTAPARYFRAADISSETDMLLADSNACAERTALTQAFTTLCAVNAAFDKYWQGDPVYRNPGAETLTLHLEHPDAKSCGPFYRAAPKRTIFTNSAAVSADPDIIAHEQGHAILDSYCHYNTGNSFTASAHEAFADVTAMFAALQSSQVREKVCQAWERGELSTMLSVIGEGARELQTDPHTCLGLRDLSAIPDSIPEKDYDEPHSASRRFSHGVYMSLRDMYEKERRQNKHEQMADTMERISSRFCSDFVNSVRWLPRQPIISQSDLAHALLQADLELHAGQDSGIYRQNLKHLL